MMSRLRPFLASLRHDLLFTATYYFGTKCLKTHIIKHIGMLLFLLQLQMFKGFIQYATEILLYNGVLGPGFGNTYF